MTSKSILKITDCISDVDFLEINDGMLICEWIPAVAQFKGGGVWQSSPLVDGKRLSSRNFDDAVETFTLTIKGDSQDAVIAYLQSLTTMLEKAIAYWMTAWQQEPVWLEARGATETNTRYAVIKGYKIEGLANPFSQPFFGGCKSLMDKFTLVIERGHWIDQYPGTALCINVNNQQPYYRDIPGTEISQVSQPADAVTITPISANLNTPYNDVGWTNLVVSRIPGGDYRLGYTTGLRFPSIDIPQGAKIVDASIVVAPYENAESTEHTDNEDMRFVIYGEKVANAPVFTDDIEEFWNIFSQRTIEYVVRNSLALTWTGSQWFGGLDAIVQEIVNQNDWVSGNAMGFLMETFESPSLVNNYRSFWKLANPPVLKIRYLANTEVVAGHEDTCSGNVYVSNKHNFLQLTHIFNNSTAFGFSTNLLDAALPWTLFCDTAFIQVGDEIYFGIKTSTDYPYAGMFDNLVFDLSQAAVDITFSWYIYDGSWKVLPTGYRICSDKSVYLQETGEFIITIPVPDGIEYTTVNGVQGIWIKAQITALGAGKQAPVQQNRPIYTCNTPFIDIDGSDIKGEISALARIRLHGLEMQGGTYPTTMVVSSRSMSRGEHFTPYLNLSPIQYTDGIGLQHPTSSIVADIRTPTGYCVTRGDLVESAGWDETEALIRISGALSPEYRGSYRVFARYFIYTGADGDYELRLKTSLGGYEWKYSDSVLAKLSGYGSPMYSMHPGTFQYADFGIVETSGYSFGFSESSGDIYFGIQSKHLVATSSEIRLIDIIIMPIDEWAGVFKNGLLDTMELNLDNNRILDIDAIGNPRTSRAILRVKDTGDALTETPIAEWMKLTRGGPFLQINADQRLWFFAIHETTSENHKYSSCQANLYSRLYTVNRYLTMRGAT